MADRVVMTRNGAVASVVEGDVERFERMGYERKKAEQKPPSRRRKANEEGGDD